MCGMTSRQERICSRARALYTVLSDLLRSLLISVNHAVDARFAVHIVDRDMSVVPGEPRCNTETRRQRVGSHR